MSDVNFDGELNLNIGGFRVNLKRGNDADPKLEIDNLMQKRNNLLKELDIVNQRIKELGG